MFCGLNAKKKNHCLISNIENFVEKIRSVKLSFWLSIYDFRCYSSIVDGVMKHINLARCIYGRDNSQQILGVHHKCVTSRALSYLFTSARILS